jgi:NADH:ubiquinone oxidoreductase subunit 11 or 4L (chain K)
MNATLLYPLIFVVMLTGGTVGLLTNRDNILRLIISLELMLLGANTGFILVSLVYAHLLSQLFVILVLSVAAAEAAIGLGLLVVAYKRTGSIKFSTFNVLRG